MKRGTLYIVATPIGHLDDLTFRGLEVLKQCDRIVCEDPRQTLKLLNRYEVHKPLFTISGPRERNGAEKILGFLAEGQILALVSDAGTPGVSDPGARIAELAREKGFAVLPVPGASALTAALSVAGPLEDGVAFLGFLHKKKGKLKKQLTSAMDTGMAVVFYESPYRIAKTLDAAAEVLGAQTRCFIGREMTKKFEEYMEGTLADMIEKFKNTEALGEFVVILKPGAAL